MMNWVIVTNISIKSPFFHQAKTWHTMAFGDSWEYSFRAVCLRVAFALLLGKAALYINGFRGCWNRQI